MEFSLTDTTVASKPVTMPASPKFCVSGARVIGGIIASLLARCGATVSLAARGRALAALRRDGLRVVINGQTLSASVRVSEDPSEFGVQDNVIIALAHFAGIFGHYKNSPDCPLPRPPINSQKLRGEIPRTEQYHVATASFAHCQNFSAAGLSFPLSAARPIEIGFGSGVRCKTLTRGPKL
jgi:choline dehydrogenase-like flavoprotein